MEEKSDVRIDDKKQEGEELKGTDKVLILYGNSEICAHVILYPCEACSEL